jgi:hypothetical protein
VTFFEGCTCTGEGDSRTTLSVRGSNRARLWRVFARCIAHRSNRAGFFGIRVGWTCRSGSLSREGRTREGLAMSGRCEALSVTKAAVVAVELEVREGCERTGNGANPVRLGCNIPRTVLEPEPPRC